MSRQTLIWLACTIAILCGIARPARAAVPLTLEEVLSSVRRTHPGLDVAERGVDRADAKALGARGGFDPVLSIRSKWTPVGFYNNGQVDTLVRQATPAWGIGVYGGYRLGWGSYQVYKGDLQTLSGGEVRAGIDVPLWRNGPIDRRRADIKQSKIRSRGARRARDATQLGLERAAAMAYWDWIAAGLRTQVVRDLLEIAQRRQAALDEQAAAGAIERLRLVDNRRLVLDRETKLIDAERELEQTSVDLSLFLRDEQQAPMRAGPDRLPISLPEAAHRDLPGVEQAVQRALRRRPELAFAAAQRKVAKLEVRLARNQRAPAVNVQTFVAKDLGDGPAELGPTEWGAGVVFEMPLPLRQARGEYRAAKAELAAVEAQLRGLRDKIGSEVRKAHVAVVAAARGVALSRQQVEAADELADAERSRLAEGASDLVVVNLRELAAADAAQQLIDSLADLQRAHADFMIATGVAPDRMQRATSRRSDSVPR